MRRCNGIITICGQIILCILYSSYVPDAHSEIVSVFFFFSRSNYRSEFTPLSKLDVWSWNFIYHYLSDCVNYWWNLNTGCSALFLDRIILLCIHDICCRDVCMCKYILYFLLFIEAIETESRAHGRILHLSSEEGWNETRRYKFIIVRAEPFFPPNTRGEHFSAISTFSHIQREKELLRHSVNCHCCYLFSDSTRLA